MGPYYLVPSIHTSPETGGTLDYGIQARTLDGRPVIIGEFFAKALPAAGQPIRINTKRIGERIVRVLNENEGIKP